MIVDTNALSAFAERNRNVREAILGEYVSGCQPPSATSFMLRWHNIRSEAAMVIRMINCLKKADEAVIRLLSADFQGRVERVEAYFSG